LCNEIRLNRS